MNTERFVLGDEVWEKVSPHLPGKARDCGVTAANNRLFLEAGFVAGPNRVSMARSGGGFRQLEQCFPALSPVGEEGSF